MRQSRGWHQWFRDRFGRHGILGAIVTAVSQGTESIVDSSTCAMILYVEIILDKVVRYELRIAILFFPVLRLD